MKRIKNLPRGNYGTTTLQLLPLDLCYAMTKGQNGEATLVMNGISGVPTPSIVFPIRRASQRFSLVLHFEDGTTGLYLCDTHKPWLNVNNIVLAQIKGGEFEGPKYNSKYRNTFSTFKKLEKMTLERNNYCPHSSVVAWFFNEIEEALHSGKYLPGIDVDEKHIIEIHPFKEEEFENVLYVIRNNQLHASKTN